MGLNFLQKQKLMIQKAVSAGEDIGMNRSIDMMMLVLTDPKYMGKDTIGKKRWMRIYQGLIDMDREYGNAFSLEPDADVCQEKIDARWKLLIGDDYQPFKVRYPDMNFPDYTKRLKQWK